MDSATDDQHVSLWHDAMILVKLRGLNTETEDKITGDKNGETQVVKWACKLTF